MLKKETFIRNGLIGSLFGFVLMLGFFAFPVLATEATLSITQKNHQITLELHGAQADTIQWFYAVGSNDCYEERYSEIPRGDNQDKVILNLTQETLQISHCFKIEIDGDILSETYQPDDRHAPKIVIQKLNNTTIFVDSEDRDIDKESWHYYWTHDERPDCQDEDLDIYEPIDNFRFSLRKEDANSYLCFRVTDVYGNQRDYLHQIGEIDTTGPPITINQKGSLLSTSSSEAGVRNWSYIFSKTSLNCQSAFLNNKAIVNGRALTLTSANLNDYFCFRAADASNNYGYAKYKVVSIEFNAPQLGIEQSGLKIIIKSEHGIKSLHYLKSITAMTCNAATDFSPAVDFTGSRPLTLTKADNKQYICIRGINMTNVAGYAKWQFLTGFKGQIQIDIDSEKGQAQATTDIEAGNWLFLKTKKEPPCNQADNQKFEESNIERYIGTTTKLSTLDNGQWLCFRVTDKNNNHGYKKIQINNITQVADSLTLSPTNGNNSEIAILGIIFILAVGGLLIYQFKKPAHNQNVEIFTPPDDQSTDDTPHLNETQATDQSLDYLENSEDKDNQNPN